MVAKYGRDTREGAMKLPKTQAELDALLKQEKDVAWIQGFQVGYSEALMDSLEAKVRKPEPQRVPAWRN
jgi:hypothetical protein